MRQMILNLYYEASRDLREMKKSEMKLSERIKYEKAMVRLDIMKQLMDKKLID